MLHCPHFSCSAKTRGNFIKNKQYRMFIAQSSKRTQILWMVKMHTYSALYNRLNNNRCNLLIFCFQQLFYRINIMSLPVLLKANIRSICIVLRADHSTKQLMVAVLWITNRHTCKWVAVVAAFNSKNLLLSWLTY